MKIPSHWSKATAEDTDQNGQRVAFSCWRSSDRSPEEAHESALDAAKRVVQKMLAGKSLDRYSLQANYATCRFLGAIGSGAVHPELEAIIEVHDKATRCLNPLELA
jgi:hypothetical protein